LEANSSTPGFWAETFVFNELIANHFGYTCPNHKLALTHTKDLVEYLKTSFPTYFHGCDTVYFSFPYAGNHEDILSFDARVGYFEELRGKARFLYTEEFVLETDVATDAGLKTFDGDPVRYLFLHYPNEWLIQDAGEVEDASLHFLPPDRPWDYIEQLCLEGKLYRIPPITSEIIQNKGFFAFLWEGVHQQQFDDETEQVIRSLIPQTYCTYDEAQSYGLQQIWEKPIYGREGAGIILWENRQEVIDTYDPEFDDNDWYQNMLAVFQQNCDMPIHTFADESLLLMFTVYLSPKGRATGIGCRAVPASKRVIDSQQGLWFPVGLA
jgi:glutathionylspermidine synthase